MITLHAGDRVAYSVKWLRSVAAYTGDFAFRRGRITEIKDIGGGFQLASIVWDGEPDIAKVNVNNLTREDRIAIDAALHS